MMEEIVSGADEMQRYAANFVRALAPGKRATVVALEGDLGVGKTTFVQGALRELGVTEVATSPTFVIQKNYPLAERKFAQAVHIDAYRLKSAQELQVLGWGELLNDAGNLIFIEWPERVLGAVPEGVHTLKLRYIDGTARGVEVQ